MKFANGIIEQEHTGIAPPNNAVSKGAKNLLERILKKKEGFTVALSKALIKTAIRKKGATSIR